MNRNKREDELDEEIRAHLAMAERDLVERGQSAESAREAARREFGNATLLAERTREVWRGAAMEQIQRDIGQALRTMRRSPAFALTAVLSLALGIGINTATFSMADALLLRPLAIREPQDVVTLSAVSAENAAESLSWDEFEELRLRNRSFRGMTGYTLRRLGLSQSAGAVPRMKMGMMVTDGFFNLLGVEPKPGRGFTDSETRFGNTENVVVLSHDYWREEFASDPGVVGRTVRVNGVPHSVVGVAPESFTGMDIRLRPAFYLPLVVKTRTERTLSVKARLKEGASVAQAQGELTAWAGAFEERHPETNRGIGLAVRTEFAARVQESWTTGMLVGLLLALSGLVLLISCANVASLLLARARARTREISIRLAIGAGRGRLFQQLLTESLVLALLGGVAGLGLANSAIRYFAAWRLPTDTPIVIAPDLDGRVLFYAVAASVLSAVLFGVLPAWRLVHADVSCTLKPDAESGVGARLLGRRILVAGQVAMSLVLLVASAILLDSFRMMLVLDPGIRTTRVMMMEFDPALSRHSEQQTAVFYARLLERVRSLAGVEQAALAGAVPFRPNFTAASVVPEGFELPLNQRSVKVETNIVEGDYFSTMDVTMVSGRAFRVEDTEQTRRVAVVNQEFARRYWGRRDAAGRRFRLGEDGPMVEVVGVARVGKYLSLTETPQPYVYLPYAQNKRSRMTLLVRSAGVPAADLTERLLREVRSLDGNMTVFNVRSVDEYYESGVLGPARLVLQMVGVSGAIGLALAVVGLYGLVAYSVSRRTREIGIRMAIGAGRGSVLRLVLRQGLTLALCGVAAGLVLSVPLFQAAAKALAGLGALSPWTLLVVPLVLVAVTLLASIVPAWAAARIDPVRALRWE